MSIFFPTIKKLYPYYLKKIFNWTFWLTVAIGFLWTFSRLVGCHILEEKIKEADTRRFYLSDKEKEELREYKSFVTILSTDFPEKKITIENIFNQSLIFFLVWVVGWGGAFVIEPVIRNLLAVNRPANGYDYWKKGVSRTREDELILLYTAPIRRREMVLSKMLAFITRHLIVSFIFSTLPYLINPHNLRLNNWTLLIKFFFFDGLLFPLIFSFFFAFFFWFIELSQIVSVLSINSFIYFLKTLVEQHEENKKKNLLPALPGTKNDFLSKHGVGLRIQSLIVICFLLWGFFFGWLHISDFEEIQFN